MAWCQEKGTGKELYGLRKYKSRCLCICPRDVHVMVDVDFLLFAVPVQLTFLPLPLTSTQVSGQQPHWYPRQAKLFSWSNWNLY